MPANPTILYTLTDEAPALATYSLLPILQAFAKQAGVALETRDISLSGRILGAFSDQLPADQQIADDLSELGAMTLLPEANIVKLPNISASVPQLKAAIAELQQQGYALPDFPDEPASETERETRDRYDKIKGSAVNPVLREGNSDRRAPKAVKEYARNHPHSMGAWSADSRTRVATMAEGDFFSNEISRTIATPTAVRIEFVDGSGNATTLKEFFPLLEGEILDATVMRKRALEDFLAAQIEAAKNEKVLFSLHLKATMMKVSDPIIFGHAVRVFFQSVIEEFGPLLEQAGVDFRNGFGDLVANMGSLPDDQREALEAAIAKAYLDGPDLAMVNSDKGITNLHVPSDVIVDASMPAMIRGGGKMWNRLGHPRDTLAVIPDSSYATVYQAVIDFCKQHGALDPKTMGSVPNVGLMAKAAEEYGSHDKTFEAKAAGRIRIVDSHENELLGHDVEAGDIWRACQTKDASVQDWIRLAVNRARASATPAVFWLDRARAHDREILAKVDAILPTLDTENLDIRVLAPAEACKFSLERIAKGEDTISVTGNVLRDYLTDLFPILEVGTSAKMLSIVPLMNGGGLFETGAGGSAPKHVEQLIDENYLRWDSLGEFFAIAASFEHLAASGGPPPVAVLAETLDAATGKFLEQDKSPTRRLGGIDNRGSHFYLALYWAEALAAQNQDPALKETFIPVARELAANESKIVDEMIQVQGKPVDIGGYYRPNPDLVASVMRPSETFNAVIRGLE